MCGSFNQSRKREREKAGKKLKNALGHFLSKVIVKLAIGNEPEKEKLEQKRTLKKKTSFTVTARLEARELKNIKEQFQCKWHANSLEDG